MRSTGCRRRALPAGKVQRETQRIPLGKIRSPAPRPPGPVRVDQPIPWHRKASSCLALRMTGPSFSHRSAGSTCPSLVKRSPWTHPERSLPSSPMTKKAGATAASPSGISRADSGFVSTRSTTCLQNPDWDKGRQNPRWHVAYGGAVCSMSPRSTSRSSGRWMVGRLPRRGLPLIRIEGGGAGTAAG